MDKHKYWTAHRLIKGKVIYYLGRAIFHFSVNVLAFKYFKFLSPCRGFTAVCQQLELMDWQDLLGWEQQK